MLKNTLFSLFIFSFSASVWACPNCAGSENASDKYTVYILAAFIVMTYIPFYILFKMANKNKDTHSKHQ